MRAWACLYVHAYMRACVCVRACVSVCVVMFCFCFCCCLCFCTSVSPRLPTLSLCQRELDVARAVAAAASEGVLSRVNSLEVEEAQNRPNLKESVSRRGSDGLREAGALGELDPVDWFYVATRACKHEWCRVDLR